MKQTQDRAFIGAELYKYTGTDLEQTHRDGSCALPFGPKLDIMRPVNMIAEG